MTSNLANEEIAEQALQLRKEAAEVHKQRIVGDIGQLYMFYICLVHISLRRISVALLYVFIYYPPYGTVCTVSLCIIIIES